MVLSNQVSVISNISMHMDSRRSLRQSSLFIKFPALNKAHFKSMLLLTKLKVEPTALRYGADPATSELLGVVGQALGTRRR